jgi:UDP-N-acetylmuramate dehydrogenase
LLVEIKAEASLRPYTTLRAGGNAETLVVAKTTDQLAAAYGLQPDATVLGWGSNVLPSDAGVPGLTIVNHSQELTVREDGFIQVSSGFGLQELFIKTAQAGLRGLEYAVGIPGTVGGALVSNAGAYRSSISEFVTEIEIVSNHRRQWVSPDWMEFSYRDSRLRKGSGEKALLLRIRFRLERGDPRAIYSEARDYQRQRISKQPPSASAGSFFKNVVDPDLAQRIPGLSDGMRRNGVVPAGFLIDACGLKGTRHGGAMLGSRHANFILNVDRATATEIRQLADLARTQVFEKFGARIEEEVMYLGDWSSYRSV